MRACMSYLKLDSAFNLCFSYLLKICQFLARRLRYYSLNTLANDSASYLRSHVQELRIYSEYTNDSYAGDCVNIVNKRADMNPSQCISVC